MAGREDLLLSAGIDPGQPLADALALCFRSMPLRRRPSEPSASLEDVFARGFFGSLEECRRCLEFFGEYSPENGEAFGISWPWSRVQDAVVSPALPLRLRQTEEDGPDGAYRLQDNRILREAAGEETCFLDFARTGKEEDFPFDLLCFGPMERYLLQGGILEIEDLFCRLRVGISAGKLESLFIRTMRMDPTLIEGLSLPEMEERAVLSIARPADPRFLDPEAFFRVRADIREVSVSGKEIELHSERDEHAVFRITEEDRHWCAEVISGSYMLQRVDMRLTENHAFLEVFPAEELNLLAPGKRGRLAFDLHSDCVMLTTGKQS